MHLSDYKATSNQYMRRLQLYSLLLEIALLSVIFSYAWVHLQATGTLTTTIAQWDYERVGASRGDQTMNHVINYRSVQRNPQVSHRITSNHIESHGITSECWSRIVLCTTQHHQEAR